MQAIQVKHVQSVKDGLPLGRDLVRGPFACWPACVKLAWSSPGAWAAAVTSWSSTAVS